ncbi:MAG TPA: hypothetical protein VEX18_22910 [Polyangiaceae bacterium]|nr:hypothetical protein [Polyangiaceae bacterium]
MKCVQLLLAAGLALSFGSGCTVGDGEGSVTTDRLYLQGCWNGPFNLKPDFFAANPYREESLLIRVQRGDNNQEASDGLTVIVNDLKAVRAQLGQPIPVGLPSGVTPPGQVPTGEPSPLVTLALYLHQTCHEQNSATYSVSGNITFTSIFSGDPNEEDSESRLTDATFAVQFADPRELVTAADPAAVTSNVVTGNFHFFFQRGQPAQPFQ